MNRGIAYSILHIFLAVFAFTLAPGFSWGSEQASDTQSYDPAKAEKVKLQASKILPDDLKKMLKGDHYTVDEKIINVEGMNSFTIRSDFGDLAAESNYLLRKRIEELPVIANLTEITRGEAFIDSQVDAIKASVDVTVEAAKDPVGTVKAIPGGVLRLFSDGYQDVKEGAKFVAGQAETEGLVGESLGTGGSIRSIAKDFKVDPYSRNSLLQNEMKRLSWFMAAGKKSEEYTRKITQKNTKDETNSLDVIWELSLAKLIERNKQLLEGMGIDKQTFVPLFENRIYIPSEITRIVNALDAMKETADRSLFIAAAAQARTIDEAVFYLRAAELLSVYHLKREGLKEVLLINLVPTALTADRRLIIASPLDYAVWTKYDNQIIDRFIELAKSKAAGKTEIWVEGLLADRAKKELDKLGVNTFELAFTILK